MAHQIVRFAICRSVYAIVWHDDDDGVSECFSFSLFFLPDDFIPQFFFHALYPHVRRTHLVHTYILYILLYEWSA